MSKILVVVAHADELAFHIGGTIAKFVAQGHQVYQVVVTTGSGATFTMEKAELELIIRKETRRSAELLGLKDVFLWDYNDSGLGEGKVKEIQERLIALVRYLKIDTLFTFDPFSPRDYHPDQLIVGKAAYGAAYFSGFPLFLPHLQDIGLEPHIITDRYYFAYHPEGDLLNAVDISETIEKKVEAVLAFESQMRWCGEIEVAQRSQQGHSIDQIDIDNYGPVIADDVRREAAERGRPHGLAYAEVVRHIVSGEGVLT